MPMKVREVIRLLEKHGWVEMRSRGKPSARKRAIGDSGALVDRGAGEWRFLAGLKTHIVQ